MSRDLVDDLIEMLRQGSPVLELPDDKGLEAAAEALARFPILQPLVVPSRAVALVLLLRLAERTVEPGSILADVAREMSQQLAAQLSSCDESIAQLLDYAERQHEPIVFQGNRVGLSAEFAARAVSAHVFAIEWLAAKLSASGGIRISDWLKLAYGEGHRRCMDCTDEELTAAIERAARAANLDGVKPPDELN